MAEPRSSRDGVTPAGALRVALHWGGTLACSVVVVGCGGGGSQAAGGSRPTPSPSAAPSVFGTPAGSTAFAVSSVPAGLTISYSDGVETLIGATPDTISPPLSNVALAIAFAPNNGNAVYTFVGTQRNDGTQPVLYNERADTSGSIGTISTMPMARAASRSDARSRAAAAAAMTAEPRRATFGALGRPTESATRVVVRYRPTGAGVRDAFVAAGGRRLGPVDGAGVAAAALDAPSGTTARAYAAGLRARPDVVDAWPDVREYTQSTTPVSPNDTHFDDYQQWSAFATGAVNAWGYTEGSPGIAIAIVDTGVDFSHPDVAGAKIAYAESDVDGVTTIGAASAQDTDGHGTNVAGIAAADTNNGYGFAGIGFNSSLQIYKVFADDTAENNYAGGANGSDVTLAIYAAVAHGARVINLSLGACAAHGYDVTQQTAVAYAIAHGAVVVAAAGNERGGTSADPACRGVLSTIDFPAAYDGVLAVGASEVDDSANPGVLAGAREGVASYSNVGPGLSLVAPGGQPTAAEAAGTATPDLLHWIDGLYSTTAANPNVQCKVKTDCRALFAGTSQATPHVSGAAALLLAVDGDLSVARVRSLLLANADDIGDPNQGSGRLDPYRALAALEGDPAPPAPPTARNFVAFAYTPSGTSAPHIIDVTYPTGIPVDADGTFRIVDVPANAPSYKIGVWYDANGDGLIDAGDYFGSSGPCAADARCTSAASIAVTRVATP